MGPPIKKRLIKKILEIGDWSKLHGPDPILVYLDILLLGLTLQIDGKMRSQKKL